MIHAFLAGSQQVDDPAAYWRCQLHYLTGSGIWLPTINAFTDAQPQTFQTWSSIVPAACTGPLLLVLDVSQCVMALRFLQGCAEEQHLNQPCSLSEFVLIGKVADLHQHLSNSSPEKFCLGFNLELDAAYSTSKPRRPRCAPSPGSNLGDVNWSFPLTRSALQTFAACSAAQDALSLRLAMLMSYNKKYVCCRNGDGQLARPCVPCKSTFADDADVSAVSHLAEGPYFVFHLKHHSQRMSKKRQQM